MASASLWAQLEQDAFETGFSSFMNGLPDFAGSFTAESSFSPRASPPPPSVPETALTSTRDTPHGADPIPTLAMAWPMATIADDIPWASVVVAPEILQHMLQPRPPLLQAAVQTANSDGQTQGAEEPWLRYQCRYPGCNHHYASTDGVRKHCRKKHSEWLRGLGPGVALFSQVALPFNHALTPVMERKAEGERGVDETGEPDDESDDTRHEVQHEGLGPPVPDTRPDAKRSRAVMTASRVRSGSSSSSSASTMQRDSSAGTGKRKGSTRAHGTGSSREDN